MCPYDYYLLVSHEHHCMCSYFFVCVVYESSNGWINVKLIELFYQDFVPKSLYLISMDLPLKLDNWALPSVWGETWSWHHLSPHTNPTGWGWPRAGRRQDRRCRRRIVDELVEDLLPHWMGWGSSGLKEVVDADGGAAVVTSLLW